MNLGTDVASHRCAFHSYKPKGFALFKLDAAGRSALPAEPEK